MSNRNTDRETVVVVAAMKVEAQRLLAHLQERKDFSKDGWPVTAGMLNENRIITVQCGMGPDRAAAATQMAVTAFEPDMVVNVGCAGGIALGIGIGDLVIADQVALWNPETSVNSDSGIAMDAAGIIVEAEHSLADRFLQSVSESVTVHRGLAVSAGQVVSRDEQRREILEAFPDAVSVDMESAALGYVCRSNGIPFAVIRGISDLADDSAVSSQIAARVKQAAALAADVLLEMLSRPK